MWQAIVFAIVVFIAGYCQGVIGFGQALIFTPLAFALFDKPTALTAAAVLGLPVNLYLMITVKTKVDTKLLSPLLVGGIIGLPVGLSIAEHLSFSVLQIAAGVVSIISVIVLLKSATSIGQKWIYNFGAGIFSGILQTTTTALGPPIVLVLTAQKISKQTMRKIMPIYFFCIGVLGCLVFVLGHLFNARGLVIGLLIAPFALAGGYLGNRQGGRIHAQMYRWLTLGAVFITGLFAIGKGLT